MATSLLQVRVEDSLKDEAARVFENLGIDTSTAVRMFFEKIRFVGLHKYSADFSDFRAGIRPFAKNFRLIFVQYAVSGDF